jgi:ACS family glucarate transporter-like MFS transporter
MPEHKHTVVPSRYRWLVAFLFFLVYTIAAADRANLGIALPFIRKAFHMSNTAAGGLVSLFLIAYAVAQLPSAWLLTRFGVRRVFPLSIVFTGMMTCLTGIAGQFGVLGLIKMCRVGLGVAEGPLPIGISTTINHWFPSREKGTASGIFLSSVKFGPVLAPILGTMIISAWGWQRLFILYSIPMVLLAIVWYKLVPNKPELSPHVNAAECAIIAEKQSNSTDATNSGSRPIPWLDKLIRVRSDLRLDSTPSILKSGNILGCAFAYCCQLGISSVMLAWIPTYLLTVKKLSVMGMGFVAAAPWVGAVAGNILGGMLSDKLLGKRRKPGMLISALATAGMMFVLINAPASPVIYAALLFSTGLLLSIGFSAYMAYPMNCVSKEKFPIASAVVNMGGQLGAAAAPFIAGLLLDHLGWDAVFSFMGAISLLTFIVVLSIVEPLKVQH